MHNGAIHVLDHGGVKALNPLEEGERCQRCTCKWCGYGLREGSCWICPSRDENSSIDAPNSFNDLPNVFTHPPQPQYETYSCELCGNDSHHGYDCPPRFPLVYEQEPSYNQNFGDNYYPQNSPSFLQQYLNCEKCGGPHEDYQCQPWHQNYSELNPCYDFNPSGFNQPPQYSIDHQPQIIQEDQEWISKLNNEFIESVRSMFEEFRERLQAANISTHTLEPSRRFNSFYDDDDYEESTIPLNEIVSQIPPSIAITPVLPTLEPEDSLIMGNEELSTIPEKESDEVIKSSVEDLVPIPSESEDTSGSDSECDLPSCDDFSPINIPEGKSVTFSNPLFDSNDDFTSSDDESLSDEDNIESKDSYVSNLDEPALLVTPLSDANEDECFDPGGEIDEIDAFLDINVSTDIENDYHDSEGDIIYLESLLINDTIPDLPPEGFLDHDPKNLKDEPDKDDLKNIVKVFDPGIYEKIISLTYVRLPFEDCHYLSLTYVIRIFLPYLTYSMDSSLLLSSGSEDTIFDPDISTFHFSSLELVASHQSGTFMCFKHLE
ncbi:hypothetical protein Tco_0149458 [Tanacetum coccineum]